MKVRRYSFFIVVLVIMLIINFIPNQGIYLTSQGLDVKRYIGLNNLGFKNYTGKSVTVAIIDSGLNLHNDIKRDRIKVFMDFVNKRKDIYDDFGHGTAIAGIIGANGKLNGMAPSVSFVILKALNKDGECRRNTFLDSLEWLKKNIKKYNVQIVNISVGVMSYIDTDEPINKVMKELSNMGVLIICSAGNDGPNKSTILLPGTSPYVITIGSCKNNYTYTYTDDAVTNFSSRGDKEKKINKPDLVTLGVDIMSLDFKKTDGYSLYSGTSFSTAVVSGIAAILMEKYKDKPIIFINNYIKKSTIKLANEDIYSEGSGEIILK